MCLMDPDAWVSFPRYLSYPNHRRAVNKCLSPASPWIMLWLENTNSYLFCYIYLPRMNKTRSIGLAVLPQHRSAFPPLLTLEFPMFSDSISGLILHLGSCCCLFVFLSFSMWFVPKVTLNKIPYIGFHLACFPGNTTMTQLHFCLVPANSLKFSAF